MSKHRTRGTRLSRLLSGVLCLALMLGLLPSAGLIQPAKAAHWADPYAEQLVEWGVVGAASDLRLNDQATRAEFVAMCNRAFGYKRLGSMPFVDVPSSAWYAQDINIAYNAGYFNGTTSDPSYPTASPNGTLTREMAAVLIARNLVLQETVGEVTAFTDSHDLSEWSRGLIGAAVAEGMIGGYEDGSYRPKQSVTRGEVFAMLVRVIGTPISKEGDYELGSVYGNTVISSSNVTLRNTVIAGNLYITGGVDLGNVLLENVTVLGRVVVSGGGESHAGQSSVVLRNVAADELVIDSLVDDRFVTVSAYGITNIPNTYVRSDTWLEDASSPGYGLQYIELNGDPGTKLQLVGTIKEVVNKTPFSDLQLVQGTAQKITIDEYATGSTLLIDINTRVDELNLDVATLVTGMGDITNLNIWASGCEVDILPDKVTVRPGITATVAGELIGSTEAAELSSDPRLLAGYPKVANLTPTQVEGQFSGNKSGTIYYAISEVADGSVSEEHLVNNPAYGGIIYQGQAGSIASSSRTVYSRSITKLQPDGSYYLTAMLEDGRGIRSPIKVISFTTPDNTKPEFLNGRISRATCDVVQLTGMANKSCTLYWVMLAQGAAAPTPQNFKSGTFGGNVGRGSLNVTKNVPVSITVNDRRLQENVSYDLYVWLNDFDGAQSSQVYKFPVKTPDETPPVIIDIMQSDYGESDAQVTFKINEHPSTLYWAVVTEANADTYITTTDSKDRFAQIKIESGATSIVHGGTAARGANVDTDILKSVLKGLDYKTYGTHSFKLFYVAKDAAGNYSDWGKLDIHTLDTDPPHAWLEYSVNGVPQANSDIRIVFDEQVKGPANAKETFLKLYEDAVNSNNTSKLASELAAHFQLWYVPTTGGSPTPVPVRTPGINPTSSDHWINWNDAVITMENGHMVIILAAGKAISLQSGANYYFQLTGVYDDAYTPNGVAVEIQNNIAVCVPEGGTKSDNGNGRLYFSTLYAQVELYQNTSVSSTGSYRLDLVVDVKPKSTGKVPPSEYWDLIMWSDTVMTVDVYRQEIKLDDNGNEPQNVTAAWTPVAAGIRFNYANAGVGLTNATTSKTYGKVQDGLKEGYLYRYGIHITSMGSDGIPEGADHLNSEPTAWSDLVTMKFSLIAGTSGNVSDVSKQVNLNTNTDANYNNYLARGAISEIGVVYTGKGTESILSCSKQFRDTEPPSFESGYPKFNTGSGGMIIEVALDRPGTVYYVVAPIGKALVNIDGSTPINDTNDGRTGTEAKAWTYIPEDGEDRDKDDNQSKIYFVSGGGTNIPAAYKTPAFLNIYNGRSIYGGDPKVQAGPKSVNSAGRVESISVTNLDPETKYYVYFVLEGAGGGNNGIVEIYRQDTKQAEPPTISANRTGTVVDVEVYEGGTNNTILHENPAMYYATVLRNEIASWMKTKYVWDNTLKAATEEELERLESDSTKAMSVLDAMMTRASNGKTVFDAYANETLRNNVMYYITEATSEGRKDTSIRNHGPIEESTSTQNCATDLSQEGEYVMLICARHKEKGKTEWDTYGFFAVDGLYKPDDVPPELKSPAPPETTIDMTASLIAIYNQNSLVSGSPNIPWFTSSDADVKSLNAYKNYGYSFTITIVFSKPIYVYRDGARKQVVAPDKVGSGNDKVSILSVMSAPTGVLYNATSSDNMSFTLTLSKIKNGQELVMFDLYNSGGVVKSDKTLTIKFETKTAKELAADPTTQVLDTVIPRVVVTWK